MRYTPQQIRKEKLYAFWKFLSIYSVVLLLGLHVITVADDGISMIPFWNWTLQYWVIYLISIVLMMYFSLCLFSYLQGYNDER